MSTATNSSVQTVNGFSTSIDKIPVLSYGHFQQKADEYNKRPGAHCVTYYACAVDNGYQFFACFADDETHELEIVSHQLINKKAELLALTKEVPSFHGYEREMAENFGIKFLWHPWPKPLRFPHDATHGLKISQYPFYRIDSEDLHEVGVGPIHAGVIEPGHFRFICNGETVLHLEIQLGWQHRGIEKLMLNKPNLLQKNILAESITGDTAIGHGLAFAQLMEGLAGIEVSGRLELERSIALELERIAVHTGDLSAMCTDVAYQFGSSVFGALRTPIVNYTQSWCGNRFGKGLIRVSGSYYPFNDVLKSRLLALLDEFIERFETIADRTFDLDSVFRRFDDIGTITEKQVRQFGGVGMVARMAGIKRDVRWSHPSSGYKQVPYEPEVLTTGDVMARALLRRREIEKSIDYLRDLIHKWDDVKEIELEKPRRSIKLQSNAFNLSMTEGWRGEICHSAITDKNGDIINYKIKDPSFHNWMGLGLALRDLEISDFPINNKSFDLSYCGHDL